MISEYGSLIILPAFHFKPADFKIAPHVPHEFAEFHFVCNAIN